MCIRDRANAVLFERLAQEVEVELVPREAVDPEDDDMIDRPVSYTHLRAHETVLDLVCRLLLEKKKHK